MKKEPFDLTLPLSSIDTSLFKAKKIGSDAFNEELLSQLKKKYQSLGGTLNMNIQGDEVHIHWQPKETDENPVEYAVDLLQKGQAGKAIPILENFLESSPNNVDALFNLGMVYSDQGDLNKAISLLERAVKQNSKHTHALVALGVAHYRNHNLDDAKKALKAATVLDDKDPYALRSLATIYMAEKDHLAAAHILRSVTEILPDDPITLLNLGECLLASEDKENIEDANDIFTQVIELTVSGDIAERAKENKRKIAYSLFRENEKDGIRSDAVMHCLDAMHKLKGMDRQEIASIALEVAQLGEQGINVNDHKSVYTIKSLAGAYSGLALVCLLHVAIQTIAPNTDSGFDVSKEYDEAKKRFQP